MVECPLLVISYAVVKSVNKFVTRGTATACQKEQCAWYDCTNKKCSVTHLKEIAEHLQSGGSL